MDTTQGNDRRDGWLSKDGVITAENVRRKGEYTAICAVKGRLGYEASRFMQETYRNLIRDMDHFDDKGYALTDSYDIAQEAIGFLCGYIGRKLTDTVTDRKGGSVTILKACFLHVNAYLCRNIRKEKKAVQMDDLPAHQIAVAFDWDLETEDYMSVNQRIEAMRLTQRQKEVLYCRMTGRSIAETARALSVIRRTIRLSLHYIQVKYYKSFNHISYCPNIDGLNLTDCQSRVVEYYMRGDTVREIANALSVTRQSIEKTLKRVQGKMQTQT